MLPELPAHAKGGGNGGLTAQGLADDIAGAAATADD
jgi:hypothetical protein